MNLSSNIGESTLLATCVFWLIAVSDNFSIDIIPFIFLSMIPISICCSIVIFFTICPIFWLAEGEKNNKKMVFKKYFPFYSIILFSICIYGITNTYFAIYSIAFFISAFITTSQCWVWFSKK